MVTNWGVMFSRVDGGSVSIEASLECGLGFPYVLGAANPASDEINYIRGGASDVSLGGVGDVGRAAGESVALLYVYVAYGASVGCAFEGAMLYGRRMTGERGNFRTNDEIFEVAGAPVSYDGDAGNSL